MRVKYIINEEETSSNFHKNIKRAAAHFSGFFCHFENVVLVQLNKEVSAAE